jgi:hypothetical protein
MPSLISEQINGNGYITKPDISPIQPINRIRSLLLYSKKKGIPKNSVQKIPTFYKGVNFGHAQNIFFRKIPKYLKKTTTI